jgi:hypothetical protein
VFFSPTPGTTQEIGMSELPSASIIAKGAVLRGWLNWQGDTGPPCGQVSHAVNVNCWPNGIGITDVHYGLLLDYDFIVNTYGNDAGVLNGATLKGDPVDSQTNPIPITDQGNGTVSGIGINSFWLPFQNDAPFSIDTELNAWHTRPSNVPNSTGHYFDGRGKAPAGWIEKDYATLTDQSADNWWPFDPDNPDGSFEASLQPGPNYAQYQSCLQECDCTPDVRGKPNAACMKACVKTCQGTPNAFVSVPNSVPKNLDVGDYVEITGTFWQDVGHNAGHPPWCWGDIFHNHDGWLEIHPVDSVKRLPAPGPSPLDLVWDPKANQGAGGWTQVPSLVSAQAGVKRILTFMLCADAQGNPGRGSYAYATAVCPEWDYDNAAIPQGRNPQSLTAHVLELIDERFSIKESVGHGASVNSAYPDCVNIQGWFTGVPSARFKASYVVWWTPGKPPDTVQPSAVASIIGQSPLTVAVTVTDVTSKLPVPGMQVWVQDGSGSTQSSATTAADGTVHLQFAACPQPYVGPHLLPPGVPSPACPIYGTLAGYSMLNLFTPVLAATGSVTNANALSVSVSDPLTKTNAAGALVNVLDAQGHTLVSGKTAADGTASLSLAACSQGYLSSCQGTVVVSKAGYLSCSFLVPSAGQGGNCQYSPYAGATSLPSVKSPHTGRLLGVPISSKGTPIH